jgi:hypothetical protein
MTYNYNDLIPEVLKKLPRLKDAPGYDDTDSESPYVAFASFLPFALSDPNRASEFLTIINEIYNDTTDLKVRNLIFLEIFEALTTSNNSTLGLETFSGQALRDYSSLAQRIK